MPDTFDIDALLAEIARYLRAIDSFREECREPSWLAEEEELACAQS